jgi:hypothetical protein
LGLELRLATCWDIRYRMGANGVEMRVEFVSHAINPVADVPFA